MNMNKYYMKKLSVLICLPLLIAGCSEKGLDENGGTGTIDASSTSQITFRSNLEPMTRSVVVDSTANEAALYAWSDNEREVEVKVMFNITSTIETNLLYHTDRIPAYPDCAVMTRSETTPSIWDYDRKISWKDHKNEHLSFLALCGQRSHVSVDGIRKRSQRIYRNVPYSEYDSINNEYYYRSGDLGDLMVACAHECTESSDTVDLNFNHIFPRVVINAKLGESNALEVEVDSTYIQGLQLNGNHPVLLHSSFTKGWEGSNISPLSQFIQMDLTTPVKLTSEYQALVDKGKEPHVLPQDNIKPWSCFSNHDGVGIVMCVKIRNQHDNSWVVGSENYPDLVFVPFPLDKLEMGHIYDINLVFGTQYRDNGTAYGFQLSYQPMIQSWETETENVELVRK